MIWLISPWISISLIGLEKSVTSQKYNILSLPPVAKYLALGEIATVLIWFLWG